MTQPLSNEQTYQSTVIQLRVMNHRRIYQGGQRGVTSQVTPWDSSPPVVGRCPNQDKLWRKFGQPPFQDLAPGQRCKQPSPDNKPRITSCLYYSLLHWPNILDGPNIAHTIMTDLGNGECIIFLISQESCYLLIGAGQNLCVIGILIPLAEDIFKQN